MVVAIVIFKKREGDIVRDAVVIRSRTHDHMIYKKPKRRGRGVSSINITQFSRTVTCRLCSLVMLLVVETVRVNPKNDQSVLESLSHARTIRIRNGENLDSARTIFPLFSFVDISKIFHGSFLLVNSLIQQTTPISFSESCCPLLLCSALLR